MCQKNLNSSSRNMKQLLCVPQRENSLFESICVPICPTGRKLGLTMIIKSFNWNSRMDCGPSVSTHQKITEHHKQTAVWAESLPHHKDRNMTQKGQSLTAAEVSGGGSIQSSHLKCFVLTDRAHIWEADFGKCLTFLHEKWLKGLFKLGINKRLWR